MEHDNNNNNDNNNNKAPKTAIAGVVEKDEHLKPTKSPVCHAEYTASDSQAQPLAFLWQNYLESTGEGVKGEFLVPSNSQCSRQVGLVSFGRQPS